MTSNTLSQIAFNDVSVNVTSPNQANHHSNCNDKERNVDMVSELEWMEWAGKWHSDKPLLSTGFSHRTISMCRAVVVERWSNRNCHLHNSPLRSIAVRRIDPNVRDSVPPISSSATTKFDSHRPYHRRWSSKWFSLCRPIAWAANRNHSNVMLRPANQSKWQNWISFQRCNCVWRSYSCRVSAKSRKKLIKIIRRCFDGSFDLHEFLWTVPSAWNMIFVRQSNRSTMSNRMIVAWDRCTCVCVYQRVGIVWILMSIGILEESSTYRMAKQQSGNHVWMICAILADSALLPPPVGPYTINGSFDLDVDVTYLCTIE